LEEKISMNKFKILSILVLFSMLLAACGSPATPAPAMPADTAAPAAPAATAMPADTAMPAATVAPAATAAPADTAAAPAANVPSVPRNQTVNLGWSLTAPVGTVNPWTGVNSLTQQGNQFMFEPLAYYGIFASKSIPWLADSMDYNADFTTLTIKLNADAAWSDGSPVTSDDVAWNFQNQMTNPKLSYNSSFAQYVKDWSTPDAKTIILNFKIPQPRFAYEVLTFKFDTGISMVPKAAYNGQADVVAFTGGQDMLHSGRG
jgi:ABC-type transport system substrate-binding protein